MEKFVVIAQGVQYAQVQNFELARYK